MGTVKVLPAATATIVGNVTLDYGLVITNYTGADLDISASISGAYGITAAGAGTLSIFYPRIPTRGLTVVQAGEKTLVCRMLGPWVAPAAPWLAMARLSCLAVPGNSGIHRTNL